MSVARSFQKSAPTVRAVVRPSDSRRPFLTAGRGVTYLAFDRDPHRSRRPGDDLGGGVLVEGVQVLALLFGNRAALSQRELTDLRLVRLARTLLGLHRILEQDAGGR